MPTLQGSIAAPLAGFQLMAHVMGMAARKRGETAVDNPFCDEPEASAAWLDGWMRTEGSSASLRFA